MNRIQAVINKCRKWGFLNKSIDIRDEINDQDNKLFRKAIASTSHVVHPLLPPVKQSQYDLRTSAHNLTLTVCSSSESRNFIERNLFKDMF